MLCGLLLGLAILPGQVMTAPVELVSLPAPDTVGAVTVEAAIHGRRSVRVYDTDSLAIEEIGQLLWAAQGRTSRRGFRTTPSAGATFPIELYLVTGRVRGLKRGVYHYIPEEHALEPLGHDKVIYLLRDAALGQACIETAAVNLVLGCVYRRTTARYGDRGKMYVHMEAGHIGQNVHLQCEALGLGTVMVGAFDPKRVKQVLRIDTHPIYIMPVGRKRKG